MIEILIVEDEALVRSSIRTLTDWHQYGFTFTAEASNGREALEQLELNPGISIVLLDMLMPVMDGIGFLEEIQMRPDPPLVLVLSANDHFELVRRAFQLGASDYLLKSEIDGETLLRELEKLSGQLPEPDRNGDSASRLAGDEAIRQLLITELLSGRNSERVSQLLEEVPLPVELPFRIALFRPDYPEIMSQKEEMVGLQAREYQRRHGEGYVLMLSDRTLLFMLQIPDDDAEEEEEIHSFCRDFQDLLKISLNLSHRYTCSSPVLQWSMLPEAYSALTAREHGESRIVRKAKKYIRRFYANPGLSLEELADYVEVSRTHLSSRFSKECGITYRDFLTVTRVEAAKILLAETNKRIYEISEEVGYPNVEHFSRLFKKVTGISPNRYQQNPNKGQ